MRTIEIDTDVYAAIWANRELGEETENEVLRRILCPSSVIKQKQSSLNQTGEVGFIDRRNGVEFPRGFQIFRIYKGARYEAVAENGQWQRLDNGNSYASLNQLNASIAEGPENVWNGSWRFIDGSGRDLSIDALRK